MMDNQTHTPSPKYAECPSDFTLDVYHANDLDDAQRETIAAHLQGCDRCQARMLEREKGFAAFGGGGEQAYLARFRNRLDEVEREERVNPPVADPSTSAPWYRSFLRNPWLPALVGAAVVLLVWNLRESAPLAPLTPKGDTADEVTPRLDSGVRRKGGDRLRVYLQRDGEVREIAEDASLTEGDQLRFKVSLIRPMHIMLVGEESQAKLYPIATGEGQQSLYQEAGGDQLLSETVELDGSIGREWIHLVSCEKSFHFSDLQVSSRAKLALPSGCGYRSLAIKKMAKN